MKRRSAVQKRVDREVVVANWLRCKPKTWHRRTPQSDSKCPLLGHIKYDVIGDLALCSTT